MRSDHALCFRALCGEEPRGTKKKKKRLAKKALAAAKKAMVSVKPSGSEAFVPDGAGDDSEMSESAEESEGEGDVESAPPTPSAAATNTKRYVHVCDVLIEAYRGFIQWGELPQKIQRIHTIFPDIGW